MRRGAYKGRGRKGRDFKIHRDKNIISCTKIKCVEVDGARVEV